MKKLSSILIALFVTISIISAQDTLYVYKAGVVVTKKAVNDLDSLSFTYTPPATGTVKDIDGNTYHWLKIGTQTWMLENLKVTKYRTGESISNVTDNTVWGSAVFGAWCDYNNDATYENKYGKLYNWNAVNDSRNIAPFGWHIPSDKEWTTLTEFMAAHLGSSTNVAKALAATTDWITDSNTGSIGNNLSINNSSGFNAFPGGYRYYDGSFEGIGKFAYFSSSTEYISGSEYVPNGVYVRILNNASSSVAGGASYKSYGFSVRCIKD